MAGESGDKQLDAKKLYKLMDIRDSNNIAEDLIKRGVHPIPAKMFEEKILFNTRSGDDRVEKFLVDGGGLKPNPVLKNSAWCASIISAFGEEHLEKKSALASELYNKNGRVVGANEELKSGDLCFFRNKGRIAHVNTVLFELPNGHVVTIGGNQSSQHEITIRTYPRKSLSMVKRLATHEK